MVPNPVERVRDAVVAALFDRESSHIAIDGTGAQSGPTVALAEDVLYDHGYHSIHTEDVDLAAPAGRMTFGRTEQTGRTHYVRINWNGGRVDLTHLFEEVAPTPPDTRYITRA